MIHRIDYSYRRLILKPAVVPGPIVQGCNGLAFPRRRFNLIERRFDVSNAMQFPTLPIDVPRRMNLNRGAEEFLPVVLVVDDEQVIADTLAMILEKNGFVAMTAYDGTSALEIATKVPPKLLISDVVMPRMTGIDLAIAIRQAVPDCKVILFSGQASTADLLATARLAGHDFVTLTKPVHPAEMLARVLEGIGQPQKAQIS
jgi:CheY-like chemotaxis protein